MATQAKKSTSKTSSENKPSKKQTSKKKVTSKKTTSKKTATKKKTAASSVKKKPDASSKGKKSAASAVEITPEERWRMIATTAYLKAEARDFAPGHEKDDWLKAEKEVDALIRGKK